MRLQDLLRAVVGALAVAVLALLPALAGGCAAARAGELRRPQQSATAEAPPAAGSRVYDVQDLMKSQPPRFEGARGLSFVVPPQSMPAPQEELWVIQRRPELDGARDDGAGELSGGCGGEEIDRWSGGDGSGGGERGGRGPGLGRRLRADQAGRRQCHRRGPRQEPPRRAGQQLAEASRGRGNHVATATEAPLTAVATS